MLGESYTTIIEKLAGNIGYAHQQKFIETIKWEKLWKISYVTFSVQIQYFLLKNTEGKKIPRTIKNC